MEIQTACEASPFSSKNQSGPVKRFKPSDSVPKMGASRLLLTPKIGRTQWWAALGQKSMKAKHLRGALLVCALSPLGCVVSGYGPPGTPPEVPLPATARVEQDTNSEKLDGPTEVTASHVLIAYKGATRAAPYIDRTKDQALLLA